MGAIFNEAQRHLRHNTAVYRLGRTMDCALRNIPRCAGKRMATAFAGRLPEHGTTFVVGAGPSLDATLPVFAAQRQGALVMASNSSVGALLRHGITPDVLVTTEHVDLPNIEWSSAPVVVASISAGEPSWQAATHFFLQADIWSNRVAWHLGCPPLMLAGNVTPSAVALALEWGAERVVLIGCDMSYDLDRGKAYADGAAWGETRLHRTDKGLVFEHMLERQRAHQASGIMGIPSHHVALELPGWGGSTVVTTHDFEMQIHELQTLAAQYPGRQCINATGRGVSLEGWREVPIAELDPSEAARVPDARVCTQEDVDVAVEQLRNDARIAREVAEDEIKGGAGGKWIGMLGRSCFPFSVSTPEWLKLGDVVGVTVHNMSQARFEVLRRAAVKIEEALG